MGQTKLRGSNKFLKLSIVGLKIRKEEEVNMQEYGKQLLDIYVLMKC